MNETTPATTSDAADGDTTAPTGAAAPEAAAAPGPAEAVDATTGQDRPAYVGPAAPVIDEDVVMDGHVEALDGAPDLEIDVDDEEGDDDTPAPVAQDDDATTDVEGD